MYKNLYLVNGEVNDRETALHSTLVYIVTIYDVITKTARVLCRTYSCPYCIVYICGEWVIYAEPVTNGELLIIRAVIMSQECTQPSGHANVSKCLLPYSAKCLRFSRFSRIRPAPQKLSPSKLFG